MIQNLKEKIGEQTIQLETKANQLWNQFSPHYTDLEPWQRGLVLIGLLILLSLIAYYLTHESQAVKNRQKAKQEAELEARLLKRMEVLKKLRE